MGQTGPCPSSVVPMAGSQPPAWAELPPDLLRQVFQLAQLGPEEDEEEISQQEVSMQTVCKAWTACWVSLPLEGCLKLQAPVGREHVLAAKSWLRKQGVSRLRHVSTNSPFVLKLLSGCTALRRMYVDVNANTPLHIFLGPLSGTCPVPELTLRLPASAQGAPGLAAILAEMPQLVTLLLRARSLDDFGQLGRVSTLRSLHLNFSGVDVPDFSPLAALPSLQRLCLILAGDLRPRLGTLSGLLGLTALIVSCSSGAGDSGTELDLVHISTLTALLQLSFYKPCVASLGPLAGMTRLTFLVLGLGPQAVSLCPLRGMAELATLCLRSCSNLEDLRPLGQLGALQELRLTDASRLTDLGPLAASTSLTSLDLNCCTALTTLRGLAGVQHLTLLDLFELPSLVDLGALAHLPNLQVIRASSLHALSDIGPLRHLLALQELTLVLCDRVVDLRPLSGLTAMQALRLPFSRTGLPSLAPLAGLVSLQTLHVGARGHPPDFTPLAGLPSLKLLAVPRSWLAGVRPILAPVLARGLELHGLLGY